MSRRFSTLTAGLILLVPTMAFACLWDYDTLKTERARFPETLELIVGKFPRHTTDFYRWRIQDRLERLKQDPDNLLLLDDLAVAYDKTGQVNEAIATATRQWELAPDRYETASNLGTFLILDGRYSEGLPWIEKALAINPDAHFGREKYQKLLVEYIIRQRLECPNKLPLCHVGSDRITDSFAEFVAEQGGVPLEKLDLASPVKGVLGMMRFADYNSPILLEALGSLLTQGPPRGGEDAKLLAARAYLTASQIVQEGEGQRAYRRLAEIALKEQTRPHAGQNKILLAEIDQQLAAEQADAEAWFGTLAARERAWIAEGGDIDARFDAAYHAAPVPRVRELAESLSRWNMPLLTAGLLFAFVLMAVGAFMFRKKSHRS